MKMQYGITRALTAEECAVPMYAERQRKEMTRSMMRAGRIIWPSVVEAPEHLDERTMIVTWRAHFEVSHG